jgi:hypothetical protein
VNGMCCPPEAGDCVPPENPVTPPIPCGPCSTPNCEVCADGVCRDKCNSSKCYGCNGNGDCVYQCNAQLCEICVGGQCVGCGVGEVCCNGTCKTAGTVSQPEFRSLYEDPVFRGDLIWKECSFTGDIPDNYYTNCLLWCGGQTWDITYGECQQPGRNCKCCDVSNMNPGSTPFGISYNSPCDCAS